MYIYIYMCVCVCSLTAGIKAGQPAGTAAISCQSSALMCGAIGASRTRSMRSPSVITRGVRVSEVRRVGDFFFEGGKGGIGKVES